MADISKEQAVQLARGAGEVGPWKAIEYSGYGTAYWAIQRKNSQWKGGLELCMSRNYSPRRFKTEAAANKAIESLKDNTP